MEKKKIGIIILSIILVLIIGTGIGVVVWYQHGIGAVSKGNGEVIRVEIIEGTGTSAIAQLLKEKNIIRDANVMKIYAKLNHVQSLKQGKYDLNNAENLGTILAHIQNGEIVNEEVKLTFVEGKNMRHFAKTIAEKTVNTEEDVWTLLEDEAYIDSLIEKYWFLTEDIKQEGIYYPLEGYLLPDTYIFENKEVSVKTIFNVMLNYMDKFLSEHKNEIPDNIHDVMTLASIAELEGVREEDRGEIVAVLKHRIEKGMSLGSDVTTYYAFKVNMGDRDLTAKEIKTENPYNTRGPHMEGKLPIGPICNPSKDAILAALNETQTENLYFVADKTKKVYFTKTYEEHINLINQLKKDGLWYEYEN